MIEENVVAAAGVHFRLSVEEIRRIIESAGFSPGSARWLMSGFENSPNLR